MKSFKAGFIEPCIPTVATRVPSGPEWLHEIKHDGYRLMARKQAGLVHLYTRNGYDWSARYPTIVQAVGSLKVESILLDGEAVICNKKGIADFDRLHSRVHDKDALLYAFDLLELNGAEVGLQAFENRKALLAKVLRKPPHGLMLSEHTDHDGELIFKHACKMGLEGIVSKRRDLPYRSGRVKHWIKVKNPNGRPCSGRRMGRSDFCNEKKNPTIGKMVRLFYSTSL